MAKITLFDVQFKRYVNFLQKSKMATIMAAKMRPWDNISRWEHTNLFTRHLQDYKKVS